MSGSPRSLRRVQTLPAGTSNATVGHAVQAWLLLFRSTALREPFSRCLRPYHPPQDGSEKHRRLPYMSPLTGEAGTASAGSIYPDGSPEKHGVRAGNYPCSGKHRYFAGFQLLSRDFNPVNPFIPIIMVQTVDGQSSFFHRRRGKGFMIRTARHENSVDLLKIEACPCTEYRNRILSARFLRFTPKRPHVFSVTPLRFFAWR